MPLQIITISSNRHRGVSDQLTSNSRSSASLQNWASTTQISEDFLTVAIMCSNAGTIHIFKLPSSVEMWAQIVTYQRQLDTKLSQSWLWKANSFPSIPYSSKSLVRVHLQQIDVPQDQIKASINADKSPKGSEKFVFANDGRPISPKMKMDELVRTMYYSERKHKRKSASMDL